MITDKLYQRIGEFVVGFQWIEDLYRQMGWFLVDPHRSVWPPVAFRSEPSHELANKVTALYFEVIPRLDLPDSERARSDFEALTSRFHQLRRQRNRFLHSAYVELKAGGEVVAMLRANPRMERDAESGELLFDQQFLTDESYDDALKEIGEIGWSLGLHYKQLLMCYPLNERAATGEPPRS